MKTLRNNEIYFQRKAGKEINDIATLFGISRQAVEQILKRDFDGYKPPKKEKVKVMNCKCFRCGKEYYSYYKHKIRQSCSMECRKTSKEEKRTRDRIRQKAYYQTEIGRKKIRDLINESNKKFPEKNRARTKLNWSVKNGKIEKPEHCSRCGKKSGRIEGHHEDYSKPLDVIWVCKPCHWVVDNLMRSS